MSDKKQTFIDPKTGEEIESTRLSKFFAAIGTSVNVGVIFGVIFAGMFVVCSILLNNFYSTLKLAISLSFGLSIIGSFIARGCIVRGCTVAANDRNCYLGRMFNDYVARAQHQRRQRLLRRKLLEEEWAGVPDRALTRFNPTGQPQPTGVSLSQAEVPETGKPRLIGSVGENSADATEGQSVDV